MATLYGGGTVLLVEVPARVDMSLAAAAAAGNMTIAATFTENKRRLILRYNILCLV